MTVLLTTLANCPRASSASIYDRRKAVYEGLSGTWRPSRESRQAGDVLRLRMCASQPRPPKPASIMPRWTVLGRPLWARSC
jgi:hypothetical protein